MGAAAGLSWLLGAATGLLVPGASSPFCGATQPLPVPLLQDTWWGCCLACLACCLWVTAGDWLAGGGGGGLEGGVSRVESEARPGFRLRLPLRPGLRLASARRSHPLLRGSTGEMTWPSRVMFSLRMMERPAVPAVAAGLGSSRGSGVRDASEEAERSGVGARAEPFSDPRETTLLFRSSGVRPRLFRISALFIQNSSMMSVFFEGVRSELESRGSEASAVSSGRATGVEVVPGTGWLRTGESEASGEAGSWQGSARAQMGASALPVRGHEVRRG